MVTKERPKGRFFVAMMSNHRTVRISLIRSKRDVAEATVAILEGKSAITVEVVGWVRPKA